MLRLLRRVLLVSAAFVVLGLTVLVVLAYAYQDEVQQKLVSELNAHLKVPVHQSGIELTLIKRFPQASLRLQNVLVEELRTDSGKVDTLLFAEDLYLEFSLLSLLSGDYTVSELYGENVRLCPGYDKLGAENWAIWKSDSSATGDTDLKLKKLAFNGLRSHFHDHRSGLNIEAESNKLAVRGRFRDEGSALSIDGDLDLHEWRNSRGVQLSDRQAEVKLKLTFGGATGAFHMEKGSELLLADGSGKTGDVPIALTISVQRGVAGKEFDLRANGFNMDLADLVVLLPEGLHERVRHYDISGSADVAVHYAGPLDANGPSLSAGMKLRDGRLKETTSGTIFRNVAGELAVELTPDGTVRKLLVKGLNASTSTGTVGGTIELEGLLNAKLKADIRGDIAISDLLRFARVDTLEEAEGRLVADAHVMGKLRDVSDVKAIDIRSLSISGKAELRAAALKMKGVRHRITGLNATLALKGNDAVVSGLRCEVQGNPIQLSGTLRNLMPYLAFNDQRLVIDAQGTSSHIDLAALVSTNEVDDQHKAADTKDYTVKFPALIDLDLRTSVDELVFEDFVAEKITGNITLKDQVLSVAPITFRSAQGIVSGSLRLDGRVAQTYPLAITADVQGMRIEQLFHEFRNFGQSFITDKHLKGKGNVRLTLTAELTPALSLDQSSLHCIADLHIDQGELNEHAPMMALADYLKTNKLVSPFVDTDELKKRLTHVKFALLENQVEIKDRTVFVPAMTVKSSAMDIEVSAAQTFDGGVDDHLNFRLGDLFKLGNTGDECGPVTDDGTGLRIFLHMFGTTQDLQFKNDGAMAAARRKEKIKQESANLKGLLSDIWKGKGGITEPEAPNAALITIEPALTDSVGTKPEATTRKKGLGRLLEKVGKNDEEQEVITVE